MEDYKVIKCLPVVFTRWWIKARKIKTDYIGPVHEFYVPWYAWPFELLHILFFGSVKIGTN